MLTVLTGWAASAAAAPPAWATQFKGVFLGLEAWQWVGLLAIVLAGLVASFVFRSAVRRLLALRHRQTGAKSETGAPSIQRAVGILGFILPYYLTSVQLELSEVLAYRLSLVVETLTIIGSVLLVYGVWDAICDALAHRATSVANAERLLIPVTRKLVRFVILTAGVLLSLGEFGVNITGLLAGVGIGGLVVALAAKDSVENVFGSLTILFDMPFALGDWVKIDKVEGIVEEINLRSTKVRTFEDSMITLPNSNLIKAAVENYGARRYRRQRFLVRVSNANKADRLEQFVQEIREYLDQVEAAVKGRTIVEVNELGEGSTGILVQCFLEANSFRDEARERGNLILAIFRAAEKSRVAINGAPMPIDEPVNPSAQ